METRSKWHNIFKVLTGNDGQHSIHIQQEDPSGMKSQ